MMSCDNVTCSNHHSYGAAARPDEKKKYCGRLSTWNYWKIIDAKSILKKPKPVKIPRSDIHECSYRNYEPKEYVCLLCKNKSKLLSFKCTHIGCGCFNENICVDCVIHNDKYEYKEVVFENDGVMCSIRKKITDILYTGQILVGGVMTNVQVKKQTNCEMRLSTDSGGKAGAFYYGRGTTHVDADIDFENPIVKYKRDINNDNNKIYFLSNKSTYSTNPITFRNESTFSCLRKNHVFISEQFTTLQKNLSDIALYKKKNNSASKIVKFIKYCLKVRLWHSIVKDLMHRNIYAKKINIVIKKHLTKIQLIKNNSAILINNLFLNYFTNLKRSRQLIVDFINKKTFDKKRDLFIKECILKIMSDGN